MWEPCKLKTPLLPAISLPYSSTRKHAITGTSLLWKRRLILATCSSGCRRNWQLLRLTIGMYGSSAIAHRQVLAATTNGRAVTMLLLSVSRTLWSCNNSAIPRTRTSRFSSALTLQLNHLVSWCKAVKPLVSIRTLSSALLKSTRRPIFQSARRCTNTSWTDWRLILLQLISFSPSTLIRLPLLVWAVIAPLASKV